MKLIYTLPFKKQNITFWKVTLLETHEVHLIQENWFLGNPSEMDTLSSVPSNANRYKQSHSVTNLTMLHGTFLNAIIISSTVRRIYAHKTFSKFPQDRIPEVTVLSLKERDIFKVLDT